MVEAEASEVMTLPQAADYLKLHPVTPRGIMKTLKHPTWPQTRRAMEIPQGGTRRLPIG